MDKYKKGKKLYRDLIEGKRQDYLNNKIIAVEQAKNPVMFWKALKGFKIKYTNIYSISLTTWENFYNQIFPLRSPVNLVPSNIYIDTLDCDISLPEFQAGFRKGRGCLDNIFCLNAALQIRLQKPGNKTYAVFIDFKRAFPSVNHNLLWRKLANVGLSDKFIGILASLYSKANMIIKNKEGRSNLIEVSEGALQGEILSPLLFALFISDLEKFLQSKGIRGISISSTVEILTLAYADDIVILADSPALLKRIFKELNTFRTENQLTVNILKTNIIIFSRGGWNKDVTFYFGDKKLQIVKKYCYLGIPFVS